MVGILFTARLGSNRLPKKHLITANGKSFIEWLILRFQHEFRSEIENNLIKLVIATSEEPENVEFAETLAAYDVAVFYGAVSNIPKRHLACADFFHFDRIISIDGDDILCSTLAARTIYQEFANNNQSNIIETIGLPLGMNASGYQVSYLRACLNNYKQEKIETGWGRIFINPKKKIIPCGKHSIYDKLRLTLDYKDDMLFFSNVITFLKDKIIDIGDEQLIDLIKKNNFDKINNHLFDVYWDNFNSLKEEEQRNEKL